MQFYINKERNRFLLKIQFSSWVQSCCAIVDSIACSHFLSLITLKCDIKGIYPAYWSDILRPASNKSSSPDLIFTCPSPSPTTLQSHTDTVCGLHCEPVHQDTNELFIRLACGAPPLHPPTLESQKSLLSDDGSASRYFCILLLFFVFFL